MSYRAPVADILASLVHVGGLDRGIADRLFPDLADGVAEAVLEEASRVAETLLLPLDAIGDRAGITLKDGQVTTAPGWPEAYRDWREGGWNGVAAPIEHGGMGLPALIGAACTEMWDSANLAFGLAPLLTAGAIEAIHRHGSAALRALYLPKLVSGEWAGTMNLTEPQAGSDVGALRTRAEPRPDGTFAITGQKIYITYGDQDMTDNIVHLVLARLPDAPAGSRGISLFLVPKRLPGPDGAPGALNDVVCSGVERKLGMHAAPTCTMVFGDRGGATGWLIGEANRGLACMFTMMNHARLAVGLQGVAAAERATQLALAHARQRRQGRGPTGEAQSPIVQHPDVARMLLRMKAETAAARALCHLVAGALDGVARGTDDAARGAATDRAALLTPLAKAYATDVGNAVASLGVQVHGGMGFIEDTGAARIMRDVRIAAIYEGTNGIQAIDLVTRKLPLGDGAAMAAEVAEMRAAAEAVRASNRPGFGRTAERLGQAIEALDQATLFMRATRDQAQVLAGATDYLRVFGLARGGAALARLALGTGDAGRTALCRFFAEQVATEAPGLTVAIVTGGGAVADAAMVLAEA